VIARFTVQPEALALSHLDTAQRLSHTDFVIRFWRDHGILVVPLPFADAVGRLPQNQRKRWREAVAFAVKRRRFFGPLPSLVRQVQLSLVSPEWFSEKGLQDLAVTEDEELMCEACRMDCLNLSAVAKALWETRAGELPERTTCDEIWDRCFTRPVQHAETITIMDRYAGRDLLRCKSERRSGFHSFLDRLPRKKTSCNLRLYTGFDNDGTAYETDSVVVAAIKTAVEHLLPIGYRFTLYLAQDGAFRDKFHYRYMRFDQSWSLKTDAGLSILEGPDLWRRATYNFDPVSDEHLQAENRFTAEFSVKALEYAIPQTRAEGEPTHPIPRGAGGPDVRQ
jgi:hypothetical protein